MVHFSIKKIVFLKQPLFEMKNQCQNFFSGIKEETRVFDINDKINLLASVILIHQSTL